MKVTIKTPTFLVLISIILTACAMPGSSAPITKIDASVIMTAAAATAYFRLTEVAAHSTITPSATEAETSTPAPTVLNRPTNIPTIEPIPAVMGANANVRSVPAKNKTTDIGGILMGQPVKVIGRNDDATWLYILYTDSSTGTGWVVAKAVEIGEKMSILPIVLFPDGLDGTSLMIPPFSYQITGTPLPPSTPPADWSKYGTITQAANVRIGPSVGFAIIGMLNPGEKITFRGRTDANEWVQIDYPSGPNGYGWVLASLVQANDGFNGLPYFDVMGTPVTPTPEQADTGQTTAVPTTQNGSQGQTATATPPAPTSSGVGGEVTIQINVRSGPAQSYPSIGMLNPKDKVVITGVTINQYWYQIKFTSGQNESGWVASQYIRVLEDMGKLPFFNNEGTQIPK